MERAAPNVAVPTVWTLVNDFTMIGVPSGEVSTVEDTPLSGADAWKTFTAGLIDGGNLTFEFNYSAAEFAALNTLKNARGKPWWKLSSPPHQSPVVTQTFIFEAIITKVDLGTFEKEKPTTVKVEAKVTGPITVAP